jgi:Tfp pilus assembly protein PilF
MEDRHCPAVPRFDFLSCSQQSKDTALFDSRLAVVPGTVAPIINDGRSQASIVNSVSKRRILIMTSLLLGLAVLTIYWPVQSFDFVNFDDDHYITGNRQVQGGLSMEAFRWSFTTFHTGNWHPLTWIAHMADFEVYGLNPGGHHWTSVLIHCAGTVLLFLVLSGMTGSIWASGLVAALFAFHPLHVESVAWVAERKDVLSGFFWILTMGAYAHYVRQPCIGRYLLVALSFVMGLLSKPMVVTLPFVLLLLDYWPLRRFAEAKTVFDKWALRSAAPNRSAVLWAVLEKIPLLILIVPSSIVTITAQRSANTFASLGDHPIEERITNALASYMDYICKTVWPVDLSVMYFHPGMPPVWKTGLAVFLLSSITYLVIRKTREMPFLLVGWLWYLGTLVPVIGIVQVGSQSMADRYTYIPLVGLFIALAWGIKGIIEKRPCLKPCRIALSVLVLSSLAFLSSSQVETWKDSVTLFEHALTVSSANPVAHNNLGAAYDANEGSCENALPHFLKAIELRKEYADAYNNLGSCAFRKGDYEDAIRYFRRAVEADPQFVRGRINLGLMMMKKEKIDAAEEEFRQVLRIDPFQEAAHTNMAAILMNQGSFGSAESHLRETLRINPRDADAHNNIGVVLLKEGKIEDAASHFRKALIIAPGHQFAGSNLQKIFANSAN